MKESIVIYARQRTALKRLTDAQRGVLLDALLTYAGGEEPTFTDGMVMVAFDFFRAQIDIDRAKYDEVCDKRREAGRSGGLAKKANATKCYQMQAKESKTKHDNDNDNVNDNDNENKNNTLTSVEATTLPTRTRTTKEVAERNIVPPTLEMVRARCLEMHYTFDPEAFHAYYETRGWMLNNRKKMKDWWAACVTWQKNEQERKQQKPNQYGSNNEDHPTNAELIRQTYELINEAAGKPDYSDALPF